MPVLHKNIRLDAAKYVGSGYYFITLCCAGRKAAFGNGDRAIWLIETLRQQSKDFQFAVHAYCVMPDHVHLLLSGTDTQSDLLAFIKHFKHTTTYARNKNRRDLWQKKYYDHILRERDSVTGVAGYIFMNPVRKGICRDPRDYPYSGLFTTDWKKQFVTAPEWVPDWKSKPKTPA